MNPETMQPGDLIFVKGKGLMVQPIKLITKSCYSHVVGYVKEDFFIGVQDFKRVKYEVLDHYKGVSDVFTCKGLTAVDRALIISHAKAALGTRYDHLLLAWQAARYLFGITLPYPETRRRICSTLWADAYRSVGIDLAPGIRYPSPADLVKSPRLEQIASF